MLGRISALQTNNRNKKQVVSFSPWERDRVRVAGKARIRVMPNTASTCDNSQLCDVKVADYVKSNF